MDQRILRLLVENARASFSELAAAVGLSANAVGQHVRRMEHDGVIRGYTALVGAVADDLTALVHLHTGPQVDAEHLEARLVELPHVIEVLNLAGVVTYEVRVRCRDQRELRALLQQIRLLPGVTAIQTRPVLREVFQRRPGRLHPDT